MNKIAFDNKLYLSIQRQKIEERIASFDGKLYIEFGGKLFDDYHASRVLPGFAPDSKIQLLIGMKDKVEILVVVNTNHIKSNKVRGDLGITYETEVMRLIDAYHVAGLYVSSVVLSFYEESNPQVESFKHKLEINGIKVYKHYRIAGYPQSIPLIVSEEGLGKNEYVKTTRPLVIVTAPGPGSGKMATCLSQLYHDNKRGLSAGYAKYETFPVWNLPLSHPVNLAYEAATVDLHDMNMIDHYHLENYGITAVNYNRDIEVFPLLKAIFEKIYGRSPYNSPTDMGVNMVGFAIIDDEVAREASKQEIIRRYFTAKKANFLGKFNDDCVDKTEMLMNQTGVSIEDRPCVSACLKKAELTGEPCTSIQLNDGRIVTGKRTSLLGATAASLLNALKLLANIPDDELLISPELIKPIQVLKTGPLKNHNTRIRAEEILIALSIQANSSENAKKAFDQLPNLYGCEFHSSVILSTTDYSTLNRLGIHITEESVSYAKKLYNK